MISIRLYEPHCEQLAQALRKVSASRRCMTDRSQTHAYVATQQATHSQTGQQDCKSARVLRSRWCLPVKQSPQSIASQFTANLFKIAAIQPCMCICLYANVAHEDNEAVTGMTSV